jgi:hypothetical protein
MVNCVSYVHLTGWVLKMEVFTVFNRQHNYLYGQMRGYNFLMSHTINVISYI